MSPRTVHPADKLAGAARQLMELVARDYYGTILKGLKDMEERMDILEGQVTTVGIKLNRLIDSLGGMK